MKVKEAIAQADSLRANTLTDEQKADWLLELDGKLSEMMNLPVPEKVWPLDNREMLVEKPCDNIYPLYLVMMIDYYNQESDLYLVDKAVYDAQLNEALSWWRRHNNPDKKQRWVV